MPSNDDNLISTEKHELDYLLRKWEKTADDSNREVLISTIRNFKADDEWGPHNRERFYEYVDAKNIKNILTDKEESPLTEIGDEAREDDADSRIENQSAGGAGIAMMEESDDKDEWREEESEKEFEEERDDSETDGQSKQTIMEESEEESDYTVIKGKAPAQKKEKKKPVLPILFIVTGVLIIICIILFIFYFSQIQVVPPIVEKTEVVSEVQKEDASTVQLQKLQAVVKINSPFLFIGDEVNLLPGEEKKLENIVSAFSGFKKISISLTGHAADVQMPDHEMKISEGRAIKIKRYFQNNVKGIDLSITTVGKGFLEPVIKDVPLAKQQANRRVEIKIISAE
jgi:outer membrane protein OmpA-like peptidoglycan-associated protein